MRFLARADVARRFEGKSVSVVGSGPGCADNAPGLIDAYDIVVRVNNYKLTEGTGRRTDVFYSFFGTSIKKTADELKRDGVTLCLCKCPDALAIESEWHRRNGKMLGVDFRWIYQKRVAWWFCDTFVPSKQEFLQDFDLLGRHIPTTGFSAIRAVLSFKPRTVYLTGFDFFRSGLHNVDDPWRGKNGDDPIGHLPERELTWLANNAGNYPITTDRALSAALASAAT